MQKCRPEVTKLQKFAIDIRVQAIANNRATLLIGVKDIGGSASNSVKTERLDLQLGEVHKIPWHQGFVSVRLEKLLLADGSEVVASHAPAAQPQPLYSK